MANRLKQLLPLALLSLTAAPQMSGQVYSLDREQMIRYTADNPFERFPDGRPKVPDELLEKMKGMSSEEMLALSRTGYRNQFEDGWQILHPEKNLVGRAVTVQAMPTRPDVAGVAQENWQAAHQSRLSHQTAIDMLEKGDVLVMDAAGVEFGGVVGDNLCYYIMTKTGNGFVMDGAIRDLRGVAPFDMTAYFRAAVPPAIHDLMITGINVPIRIGSATVMPGDVVVGDSEGVYFVPPSQVKELVDTAEITHIHDQWTKMKFDEGKYVSSDIYGRPRDPALIQEYEDYLKEKLGAEKYEQYRQRQQAAPRGAGAPPRQ